MKKDSTGHLPVQWSFPASGRKQTLPPMAACKGLSWVFTHFIMALLRLPFSHCLQTSDCSILGNSGGISQQVSVGIKSDLRVKGLQANGWQNLSRAPVEAREVCVQVGSAGWRLGRKGHQKSSPEILESGVLGGQSVALNPYPEYHLELGLWKQQPT